MCETRGTLMIGVVSCNPAYKLIVKVKKVCELLSNGFKFIVLRR